MGWVFNANFLQEQCGRGQPRALNGSSGTMAAPGAAGSAPSAAAPAHLLAQCRSPCKHSLQQVRLQPASASLLRHGWPRSCRCPGLLSGGMVPLHPNDIPIASQSHPTGIPIASRQYSRGQEGKLTLGFDDLQVLLVLNYLLATCDCPPSTA